MEAKPDLGRRVATALVALRRLMAVHDRRLVLESVLMGTMGALCARAFELTVVVAQSWLLGGVAGYKPPGLPSEGGTLVAAMGPHGLWLVPLATTLGGLLSGLLVFTLAPEAEGHGTDAAVKAYHEGEGRIRARVPVVKLVASALTIGSGGAAGREGPTALTTAGIGSVYATLTRRPERDRRLLVLMGMAAGLSAMFRSPIGAAIFAVEVLYSEMEFETGALIFTLLASVVAYGVNGALVGFEPLFAVPGDWTPGAAHYLAFAILGVASGAVATLLVVVFYTFRRAFVALPLPAALKPALGGLGVGALALLAPQVLG
ncbi:MAG TPA: chloride channel protein, partial [Planctomycetota bacterium]|nr:chloride channel protein [Planctomycetota bacterium]